jgi:hypothetical protein
VWVSNAATPDGTYTKITDASLPLGPAAAASFAPVEARFLKVHLKTNHEGSDKDGFSFTEIQVHEAQRARYTPLMTRHPELGFAGGPVALSGGRPPVSAAGPTCGPGDAPDPARAPKAAHPESSSVLVVAADRRSYGVEIRDLAKEGRLEDGLAASDLSLLNRANFKWTWPDMARPAMLAPAVGVDTVVLSQVCNIKTSVSAAFKQALLSFVAAGHKLIIQDADACAGAQTADYEFLPYRFRTDNPGAQGATGSGLQFVEQNAMLHGRPGRQGFLDVKAWLSGADAYKNELGDTNTVVDWDPNWCGQLAVRNANGVFGFGLAYAHYGRGLIIYEGFDYQQQSKAGYDSVVVRELAQGFDPDGLPCAARLGSFVLTTDSGLLYRGAGPGRPYTYALTLIPNQGYKGTVNLAVKSMPAIEGLQARLDPPSVALSGEGQSALTVTLPAGMKPAPLALEVRGTDAAGKSNTLCLQLGPPTGGELSVVSALAPPAKTRKNLEIILDASGSMKTLLGKRSRWDVALDTLQQVLAKLPDDFNVGLRIYGHREASTSPRTCTDSELVMPVEKLNRAGLLDRAKSFKPKGETPLVFSALQAPGDLKAIGGGTVILITDGEESCKGDTVKAAADLKASGLDIRLNIVGFALANPKTQKDLAGFSQATGGMFYAADSGTALADVLLVAAIDKFPFSVYDAAGKIVLTGEAGAGTDTLPAGDYKVVVKAGAKEVIAPRVNVGLGQSVTVTITMKNGQLILQ